VSVRCAAALASLGACGHVGFDPAGGDAAGWVVRYPMDDDPASGRALATAPAYDGTCTSCPSSGIGKFGGSYVFASPQWIDLPAISTGLVGAAPYTVTVWCLAGTSPIEMTLVAKPLSAENELNAYKLYLAQNTNEPVFETATDATDGFDTFAPISTDLTGAWHFLATSWDGTAKRLYLDGVLAGTEPTTIVDVDLPVLVAADLDTGTQDDFFVGALDQLTFYDHALADDEIAQLAGE